MTKMTAVIAAFLTLTACSGLQAKSPPPRKSLGCQATPQWFITDASGHPAKAVYVCFGDDGVLLYSAVELKPEQIAAMAKADVRHQRKGKAAK